MIEKPIEFDDSLQRHSRVEYYFIIVPKEVVVKKSKYLSDWLQVNKDVHVTLSPACPISDGACPERSSPEPDHKAMWEELEDYVEPDVEWSINHRTSMATWQKVRNIKAKHIPQGDPTGMKKEEK